MSAPRVRADYDQLNQIAQNFSRESDKTRAAYQSLRKQMAVLQGGDWIGQGASKFYEEMNGSVLPTVLRLTQALGSAGQTTTQIRAIMQDAEQRAAAVLRGEGAAGRATGSSGGGILSQIGGFFADLGIGAVSELWDMAKGIGNIVIHPWETVKGLAYGVTHPGELFDALTKPFVDDWTSGHPGRAIGRGVIFIGSFFVGAGEADAVATAGKAGEAATTAGRLGEAGEAASRAGRLGDLGEVGKVGEVAETGGRAGRIGESGKLGETAETGGRFGKQVDVVTRWEEYAPKAYDAIRTDSADVAKIAENTGFSKAEIQTIKDHVFTNEHELDAGRARFDADPDIADAWQRLQSGQHLPEDVALLKHEAFEAAFEREHGVNYRTAHQAAIDAGFEWKPPTVE